jgi:hypothetical protein
VLSLFPKEEMPAGSPLKAIFVNRVKAAVSKTIAYDSYNAGPAAKRAGVCGGGCYVG